MKKYLLSILILIFFASWGLTQAQENKVKAGPREFRCVYNFLKTKPELEVVEKDGKTYLKLLVPYKTEEEIKQEEEKEKIEELKKEKKKLLEKLNEINKKLEEKGIIEDNQISPNVVYILNWEFNRNSKMKGG